MLRFFFLGWIDLDLWRFFVGHTFEPPNPFTVPLKGVRTPRTPTHTATVAAQLHTSHGPGLCWLWIRFGCVPTQISTGIVPPRIPMCCGRDLGRGNWITGAHLSCAILVIVNKSHEIWWFIRGFRFWFYLVLSCCWHVRSAFCLPPWFWGLPTMRNCKAN